MQSNVQIPQLDSACPGQVLCPITSASFCLLASLPDPTTVLLDLATSSLSLEQQHSLRMAAQASAKAVRMAKLLLSRDRSLTVFTPDVRLALLRSTKAVGEGVRRWGVTAPAAAQVYAEAASASLLFSCFNKGEERVILDFQAVDTQAPITQVCAESMRLGELSA